MKLCLKSLITSAIFFFITMIFHTSTYAAAPQQFEINSLNEISLPKDAAHTLFVFDIDNTLLTETLEQEYIGSPMWFDWQKQQIVDWIASQGKRGRFAIVHSIAELYPFNDYVLNRMNTISCELAPHGTEAFMQKVQAKGFTVIAATARDPGVFQTTYRQLSQANLVNALTKNFTLSEPSALGERTLYKDGVLSLTGQNKGQFVYSLLKKSDTDNQFTNIVFVDDTAKNIDDFIKYYSQNTSSNVQLFTYHYNYEVNKVYRFNKKVSRVTAFRRKLIQEDNSWYQDFKHQNIN